MRIKVFGIFSRKFDELDIKIVKILETDFGFRQTPTSFGSIWHWKIGSLFIFEGYMMHQLKTYIITPKKLYMHFSPKLQKKIFDKTLGKFDDVL